ARVQFHPTLGQFIPIHLRHRYVGDQHIHGLLPADPQRVGWARRGQYVDVLRPQHGPQQPQDLRVVVDDQYGSGEFGHEVLILYPLYSPAPPRPAVFWDNCSGACSCPVFSSCSFSPSRDSCSRSCSSRPTICSGRTTISSCPSSASFSCRSQPWCMTGWWTRTTR